jgi:hypothetical protein
VAERGADPLFRFSNDCSPDYLFMCGHTVYASG